MENFLPVHLISWRKHAGAKAQSDLGVLCKRNIEQDILYLPYALWLTNSVFRVCHASCPKLDKQNGQMATISVLI